MGYSAPSGGSLYERNYDVSLPASTSYTPTNGLMQLGVQSTAFMTTNIHVEFYDGTTWYDFSRNNVTNADYGYLEWSMFVSNNGNARVRNANGSIAYYIVLMRWY